ncbi:MAG: helix-hairpin-helix domain-containing protein, partial [Bacteroidota bacterium]
MLLLILATVRWLLPKEPHKLPDAIGKYQEPIDSFLRGQNNLRGQNSASSTKTSPYPQNPAKDSPTLVPFDPNLITTAEGLRLGLSERQMQNLLNYRAKGGHFYRKEDLKKMYTLPESQYQELEPYIILPNKESRIENPESPTDQISYKAKGYPWGTA